MKISVELGTLTPMGLLVEQQGGEVTDFSTNYAHDASKEKIEKTGLQRNWI